jgi:hypothetical protein
MREAEFDFVAVFSDFKSDLCAIPLGLPGSKPGFAASDPGRVVRLHSPPFGTRAGNPTRNPDSTIKVGPKRHGQYFQSGFRQRDRQLTVQW